MAPGGMHDHDGDCDCFRGQLIDHLDASGGHFPRATVVAKIVATGVLIGVRAAAERPVWAQMAVADGCALHTDEEQSLIDEVVAGILDAVTMLPEPPA